MSSDSEQILERLKRLHPRVIDLSLGRVERLLERLGNPQRKLPPVVHVAGTNGKGSIIAFLRALLEAHGRRVHVYTSPHLIRFHERIVVAGEEINASQLDEVLQMCEAANADNEITFFEITTAAAFFAFSRVPADFTLLETGLGGRLDATNVIERPAATVITPIAMDHQAYLGNTLAAIAGEKAGILKAKIPCFVARQLPEAAKVIGKRAEALAAPLAWQDRHFTVRTNRDGFVFESNAGGDEGGSQTELQCPAPALVGRHQIDNAGLALAVLHELSGLTINHRAVGHGITNARWPARLQRLDVGILAANLPADWELWLDGGHNPAAGQVLAQQAACWRDKHLVLVVGMLQGKDVRGFLSPLRPYVDEAVTIAIDRESASFTAEQVAEVASSVGFVANPCTSIYSALEYIQSQRRSPTRILVCGSLYLAGAVLAVNGS